MELFKRVKRTTLSLLVLTDSPGGSLPWGEGRGTLTEGARGAAPAPLEAPLEPLY